MPIRHSTQDTSNDTGDTSRSRITSKSAARSAEQDTTSGGVGGRPRTDPVGRLHQRYGNHAVQQLVRQRESSESARESTDSSTNPAVTRAIALAETESGSPIDSSTRRRMETQFGRDFGSVRIHESVEARSTARSLDAAAATIGSDVLVGVDQFDPTMPAGWALLAHELAHVAQFDRLDGDEATLEYSAATSPIEREANRAALGTFVSDVGPIQAVPTVAVALADDDWWNTAGGIGIDMLGPAFAAESMYSGHLQTGKLFPGWMGPLTGAFGMGTGMWDMLRPDATTGERVRGGLGAFAGTTDMLRWGGMAPPLHTTVGGAFKGGGIAKALASGGAVVGAGLAGYGAGRLLDQGTGFALRQAHMAIDSARGVDRPEERYGDYSISGMYGTLLSNVDQAQVAGRRTLGTLDESEPAYKQTLGWRIAEVEQGIRGLFD